MMASRRHRIARLAALVFGAWMGAFHPAWAESDMEMQEKALKAREQGRAGAMDHSGHAAAEPASRFRGVFYGYLPCPETDCNGIKMTLSLNPKNNYLLVIQPAKLLNRESFEKGKYQWDDAKRALVLTPNKDAPLRRLAIQDEGTLRYLRDDGGPLPGDQDQYLMKRSDTADNREVHIH